MLKGYQKRVIYLKNTGSEIFKEAYFVVDERKEKLDKIVNNAKRDLGQQNNRGKLLFKEEKAYKAKAMPVFVFLWGTRVRVAFFDLYVCSLAEHPHKSNTF